MFLKSLPTGNHFLFKDDLEDYIKKSQDESQESKPPVVYRKVWVSMCKSDRHPEDWVKKDYAIPAVNGASVGIFNEESEIIPVRL